MLQIFGCTYYDFAGWQNYPSLNPLLFDPTFIQTLLHRVTRIRSRNYLRELEATPGIIAGYSRSPTHIVITTVEHSPDVQEINQGTAGLGTAHEQLPTGTVSSNSSTNSTSVILLPPRMRAIPAERMAIPRCLVLRVTFLLTTGVTCCYTHPPRINSQSVRVRIPFKL
jgi:hypothetical protein